MDPETSAQDVQRCQICKSSIAELFCVFCQIRLCKTCVGNHLALDPEKHRIVKLHDSNIALVLPTCNMHPNARCKNYCQECEIPVCSSCVSLNVHERHKFQNISNIFNKMKEMIKKDTDELEKEILPSYEKIVKEVEFNGKTLEKDFETLLTNIEKRRTMWHQEINSLVNAMKENAHDLRQKQIKAHNEHLQNLKGLLTQVQESINLNTDILCSQEVLKSLTYICRNPNLNRLPPKLEISALHFVPKKINRGLISEMIGVIIGFDISSKGEGYQLQSKPDHISMVKENEIKENELMKEQLTEPQLISIVETNVRGTKSIACTNDGKFWVSGEKGPIQLFTFESLVNIGRLSFGAISSSRTVVLENVTTENGLKTIDVTKTGALVFGRILSSKISICKADKTEDLINLNGWGLLSLCITACNSLLVCMVDDNMYACRVVRYEGSEERQIIQYDCEGKNFYSHGKGIKNVNENRNEDVCVTDNVGGAVVVTDKTGSFRFSYSRTQNNYLFRPVSIATDSQGDILVSYQSDIHIIDMNGKFLRHLNISSTEILGLAVDNADNLYLLQMSGTVNKFQYMKMREKDKQFVPNKVEK